MKPGSTSKAQAMSFFFGGLLPVIAFTVIEEKYGVIAGLIAGMVFGCGEIIWELYRHRKVQKMTWIGNGLLLVLGGVSLFSSDGIWFKLQPAIMEAMFAVVLCGSVIIKKPLLVVMAEKQGQIFPLAIKSRMTGVTFRTGLFFGAHAALATWAAYTWSTTNWALLKGVGVIVSFIIYLAIEMILIRKKVIAETQKAAALAATSANSGSSSNSPLK
jgi:intracellular septation protein